MLNDEDHYKGTTDFFYFDHIEKYQDDVDGKKRIKINMLWVPAALITESLSKDLSPEAKAIQKEARERFKAGENIRVFSQPDRLKGWCSKNNIDYKERTKLIIHAGKVIPEISLKNDMAEFFVHAPFAHTQNENDSEVRNSDALALQVTFSVNDVKTKMHLFSDVNYEDINEIIELTESKNRSDRLEWDILPVN